MPCAADMSERRSRHILNRLAAIAEVLISCMPPLHAHFSATFTKRPYENLWAHYDFRQRSLLDIFERDFRPFRFQESIINLLVISSS